MADWMRFFGFEDARRTPTGPDGGIDVVSSNAVAQVKDYAIPIGRPTIQQLVGASRGRQCLFFARMSYTPQAVEYANELQVALFRFDLQGQPEAVNATAGALLTRPR